MIIAHVPSFARLVKAAGNIDRTVAMDR